MNILLIDNYDSFTYNLLHYLEGLGAEVLVRRNDEVLQEDFLCADALVLSPGPGLPADAGNLMHWIAEAYLQKPVLGVCLGMQALCAFEGNELYNLNQVRHGEACSLKLLGQDELFAGCTPVPVVGLYHSWAVRLSENSQFIATSWSEEGVLMSVKHRKLPLYGVQFHPESVLTPEGKKMLDNFLKLARNYLERKG